MIENRPEPSVIATCSTPPASGVSRTRTPPRPSNGGKKDVTVPATAPTSLKLSDKGSRGLPRSASPKQPVRIHSAIRISLHRLESERCVTMGMSSPGQDNSIYANAAPLRMLQRHLKSAPRFLMTELLHAVQQWRLFCIRKPCKPSEAKKQQSYYIFLFSKRTTPAFPDVFFSPAIIDRSIAAAQNQPRYRLGDSQAPPEDE